MVLLLKEGTDIHKLLLNGAREYHGVEEWVDEEFAAANNDVQCWKDGQAMLLKVEIIKPVTKAYRWELPAP